jgi:HK97 family phage major capsid protein
MHYSKAKELRAKRAKICSDAAAVLENQALAAEERSRQFDTMMADADLLKTEIDRWEKVETLEAETRGSAAPPSGQPGAPGGSDDPEVAKQREERYRQAWARGMQFGFRSKPEFNIAGVTEDDRRVLTERRQVIPTALLAQLAQQLPAEYRDMFTQGGQAYPGGSGASGGFFVPTGFVYDVDQALKYYGPMLNGGVGDPYIMETASGQPLPYPTSNDTIVTGERVSENQPATSNDVNVGLLTFMAWMYSTKLVKVSIALLNDSAFDLQKFLTEQFSTRLGRILNTDMTLGTGTGNNQPNGIVTAATLGATFVGANSNDGASGANSIGTDDIINLKHSVDPLYRRGAKFMMHDSTLAAFKRLKDKYGRPLWLPGVAVSAPDTIDNDPYLINNDMDQIQSQVSSPTVSKKTLLYGQMPKYVIRKVKELSVLRLEERFAEYGQVAFLGFARYDGNLVDAGTHPVKYGINVF